MELTDGESYADVIADLEALLSGATAEDCEVVLSLTSLDVETPDCYGPRLYYEQHPDTPEGGSGEGALPPGDLGIWTSVDDATGEPCMVQTLDSLVRDVGVKINYGLYLAASAACLMNVNALALPEDGDTTELTDPLADSLAVNNPDVRVLSAAVERQGTDASENGIYVWTFEIELSAKSLTTHVVHVPGEDTSEYQGRILTYVEDTSLPDPMNAHSVSYQRDGEEVRLLLLSADFPDSAVPLMDDDGDLRVDSNWSHHYTKLLMNMHPSTYESNVAFSWQAGHGDTHARSLNLALDQDGSGCAFFGYGDRFDNTQSDLPEGDISTFICNWAGPGAEHTGLADHGQKQCVALSASGFLVTEERIEYAPVNSCETDEGQLLYRLDPEAEFSSEALANDLVYLPDDSHYSSYQLPSEPVALDR